jgi:spore maturation protein CgeB
MRYHYGEENRGLSYEYFNFYEPLARRFKNVEFFDFLGIYNSSGKTAMNQALLQAVDEFRPEVVTFSLYREEFDPEALAAIRRKAKTVVIFLDDIWRVEHSRRWARQFDAYTTSDIDGVRKFADAGLPDAVFFPFGCDPATYRKLDLPLKYDVSFVGLAHPRRTWLMKRLRKRGIDVFVAGSGWPTGPIDQAEMIRVFNQSRINLNLSNSTTWDLRYLVSSLRAIKYQLTSQKSVEQLKARHLEISGCGGFQLSQYAEGLERIYRIGEEIAIFTTPEELEEKVAYYLEHPERRDAIALAGYRRTLSEHTTESYFKRIFEKLGVAPDFGETGTPSPVV